MRSVGTSSAGVHGVKLRCRHFVEEIMQAEDNNRQRIAEVIKKKINAMRTRAKQCGPARPPVCV